MEADCELIWVVAGFESRSVHRLNWNEGFRSFPQSFQALSSTPNRLPSTPFPIRYSLSFSRLTFGSYNQTTAGTELLRTLLTGIVYVNCTALPVLQQTNQVIRFVGQISL